LGLGEWFVHLLGSSPCGHAVGAQPEVVPPVLPEVVVPLVPVVVLPTCGHAQTFWVVSQVTPPEAQSGSARQKFASQNDDDPEKSLQKPLAQSASTPQPAQMGNRPPVVVPELELPLVVVVVVLLEVADVPRVELVPEVPLAVSVEADVPEAATLELPVEVVDAPLVPAPEEAPLVAPWVAPPNVAEVLELLTAEVLSRQAGPRARSANASAVRRVRFISAPYVDSRDGQAPHAPRPHVKPRLPTSSRLPRGGGVLLVSTREL